VARTWAASSVSDYAAKAGGASSTNKLNPMRAIMGLLPTTFVGWIAGNRTFGI
jgi:hypothetical protein